VIFGFFIGTPTALISYKKFITDTYNVFFLQFIYFILGGGYQGLQGNRSYLQHLVNLYYFFNPILFVIVITTYVYYLVRQFINKNKLDQIFVYWIFIFYIIFGFLRIGAMRFIVPITPALIILTSKFFNEMIFKRKKQIFLILLIFTLCFSVWFAIETDLIFLNDSRYYATKWISKNVPAKSKIDVLSFSGKYIPTIPVKIKTNSSLDGVPYTGIFLVDKEPYYFVNHVDFIYLYSNGKISKERFNQELNNFLYNSSGDYLILSELYYGRFFDSYDFIEGIKDSKSFPEITRFYSQMLGEKLGWRIVADIKYKTLLNPNPTFVNPRIVILKKSIKYN